ncbi:saccharopine dehydrogenase NADP-binding domain-containing protein [Streptomyces sp. NPDC051572]|uniref:saccharopine dehydrogenase family protein n=1 Tax=unclassified Streptomyces TaxID=2593676 RepID=UPI00344FE896
MASTIAVVGAGRMGMSALSILLKERPDARFVAIDILREAVDRAVALAPDRVDGRVGSFANDRIDLTGVDVVINLAGPFYRGAEATAAAAVAAGAAYVDIADDIEGIDSVLGLQDRAEAAGVPVVTGAGFSPGVSNWLAGRLLSENPEADGIQIAWAVHEDDPGGLAPLRHMLHLAVNTCPVWENGAWRSSPGFVPSTARTFRFPEPVGDIEAYDTAHPEPHLLVRHYPGLMNVSCKGALLPGWANSAFSTLGRIGFGDTSLSVRIGESDIDPSEFLWKLLWARHDKRPSGERHPVTALLVQALKGDQVVASLALSDDEVMARSTGLGAAVSALVLLDNDIAAGCWGPEVLPWRQALGHYERIAASMGAFERGIQVVAPSAR